MPTGTKEDRSLTIWTCSGGAADQELRRPVPGRDNSTIGSSGCTTGYFLPLLRHIFFKLLFLEACTLPDKMEGVGFILIVAVVVIAVFACGFWIGARSFEKPANKIVAGILCGLGAIAIVSGVAFAGCMFLLRQSGIH